MTGTMRTGGSLLINLLSTHSKVNIFNEMIHFFRFIYLKYDPLNEKNLEHLLNEQKLRLKYRMDLSLDTDFLRKKISSKKLNYKNIYSEFLNYFFKYSGKKTGGEYAALQWREIPIFLKFFPKGKAIHVYRDPRAVLASWKKLSSIPNYAYLNCIFNWIDSTNHIIKFNKKLPNKNYFAVKYEDMMTETQNSVKKLFKFLELNLEENALNTKKWKKNLNQKIVRVPRSAHEGKNIIGFSTTRINNWNKSLEDWEIYLAEKICKKNMRIFGYKETFSNKKNKKLEKKAMSIIIKNNLLHQNFKNFKNKKIGTNEYPSDPTSPINWGSKDDDSKWFIETDEAKNYFQELAITTKEIEEKYL